MRLEECKIVLEECKIGLEDVVRLKERDWKIVRLEVCEIEKV